MLKTTLCAFHMKGACLRGVSCKFAHSVDELKKRPEAMPSKAFKPKITPLTCVPNDTMMMELMEDQELAMSILKWPELKRKNEEDYLARVLGPDIMMYEHMKGEHD